jgi:hypothetical protein
MSDFEMCVHPALTWLRCEPTVTELLSARDIRVGTLGRETDSFRPECEDPFPFLVPSYHRVPDIPTLFNQHTTYTYHHRLDRPSQLVS